MNDPEEIRLSRTIRRELTVHRTMGILVALGLLVGAALMAWRSFRSFGVVLSEIEVMHGHILSFCLSLAGAVMLLLMSFFLISLSFQGNATSRMVLKLGERLDRLETKQRETESEPGVRR
jgi:hypothetical protein